MGVSIADSGVHERTNRMGIREITARLNAELGPTLVATLAGAKDPKSSIRWAKADGPEPRPAFARRLQFAHRIWLYVSEAEGAHVARLWFLGSNPWLDERTPIGAIADDDYTSVKAAAEAQADGSFAG